MDKDDKKEILDAIEALARMTQSQFENITTEIVEVKDRLGKLESRENSQDNLLEKHTDDIRLLKTKVGVA